jgi:quercetin dioxygenase-like cupin family protein
MVKPIVSEPLYYGTDMLGLRPDPTGARFWEVSLGNTQLTYFEVPPRRHFNAHRHASEQITWVLEGTLFFELEGGPLRVAAGEAIAIPSNVPHGVFTDDAGAKAIDAWSPVNPCDSNPVRHDDEENSAP